MINNLEKYKSPDILVRDVIMMLRRVINADGNINITSTAEDKLNKYAISRDDSLTTTEYYGFIDIDGNWYIMKIDTITGIYTYINGTSDFLTNWGNRTTLTYNEFNNLTW